MSFDFIDIKFKRKAPEPDPEPYCSSCENGGWECYGLGRHDPHFRVCQVCGNPDDLPCP
jgi:hypothetical protein